MERDTADLAGLLGAMPFAVHAGVELEAATPQEVIGRLVWSPQRCTAEGALHGGALMTLADTVGAVCAYLNLPPGAWTATVSSTTSLMRAVRSGHARATARPCHLGRSFTVIMIGIADEDGRQVAHVTQTQAVLAGVAR